MGGIWGGHAWPEVFLDNQWIPFDAAIPGSGIADAARLRFASSSLIDGPGDLNSKSGIQMYGNAHIETLSYTLNGKALAVSSDTPYSIKGKNYVNEGLGLQVSIPASFSFMDEDAVWPKPNFLTIVGADSEKISFYQNSILPGQDLREEMEKSVRDLTGEGVDNRNGELLSHKSDGAVIARSIPIGNEFILVKYEGADAKKLAKSIMIEFSNSSK